MYCKNCGQKRISNDPYCSNCGYQHEPTPNSQPIEPTSQSNTSLVLGIIALVFMFIPVISIPLAITAIIIGNKNKTTTTPAIISLVISCLILIFTAIMIIFSFDAINYMIDETHDYLDDNWNYEDYDDDFDEDNDVYPATTELSNKSWLADDQSLLDLTNSTRYTWYQQATNTTDNYYQGTYKIYHGYSALDYIANTLTEYNLTTTTQYQNIIATNHTIDQYYLIILNCDTMIVNGTNQTPQTTTAYYYGFYENNKLSLTNIANNSPYQFTKYSTNAITDVNKKF